MMNLIEVDHEDGKVYLNSKMIVKLADSHRALRMLEKIFIQMARPNGNEEPNRLDIKLKERIEGKSFIVGRW